MSLVSVDWLRVHLGDPELVVLDTSLEGPGAFRIRSAGFLDLETAFSDRKTGLPHMMPSAEVFEREARLLGIHGTSRIVLYDSKGVYSSPRVRWMFRAMGHGPVAVLDGGLPAWIRAGFPVEPVEPDPRRDGSFVARPQPGWFCDSTAVTDAVSDPGCVVVDARSEGRFQGVEPEPRPGLRAGHIPGALNLPFIRVLESGRFRAVGELKRILAPIADPDRRCVFSCGSGVTACIVAQAAELAGYGKISVYDGSWSEWGLPTDRPVATGPA